MKINSNLKQILVYSLGLFSTKMVSILMIPIVTSFLKPSDFGTLEILQTLISLLSVVFSFGVVDALFRFAGVAENNDSMEIICNNAITLTFLISILLTIPIIIFAKQIAHLLPGQTTAWQIRYLGLAMITNTVFSVQLSWLRLRGHAVQFVVFSFGFTIILAFFVLMSLYWGYGVTGVIWSSAVSNLLVCGYLTLFYLKSKPLFTPEWQSKLFFYGLPLIFGSIAEFTILWLPNFWLGYTIPLSEFAQYALGMKFTIITCVLMSPIILWWFPNRFKNLSTPSGLEQCARITEAGIALGFILAVAITIASSIFIILFIPSSYHITIGYLAPLSFMFAVKNAGDLMNTGVFLNKTSYAMVISTVTAILMIIGLYFFIPYLHVWGVILVLNLVFTFRWLCYGYFSQRELYLPYRYMKMIAFIFIIILSLAYTYRMTSVYDYVLQGGLLGLLIIASSFSLNLIPKLISFKMEK